MHFRLNLTCSSSKNNTVTSFHYKPSMVEKIHALLQEFSMKLMHNPSKEKQNSPQKAINMVNTIALFSGFEGK